MSAWIDGLKLEHCPCCNKSLGQVEYDFQFCRSCQLVAKRTRKRKAVAEGVGGSRPVRSEHREREDTQ